jgi:histidine ammonia-lyase
MVILDGKSLNIQDVYEVAFKNKPVQISEGAKERIKESHQWILDIVRENKPVYGVNTGFGIFSNKSISPEDIHKLNRNLILSHAVGTGEAFPAHITRAAMLIRANTLCIGLSGVQLKLVETLVEMLNKGVTPVVPSQGSMGSSGDLAPLSHLALVFTTDANDRESESNFAEYQGKVLSGKQAMQEAGIPRIELGPKESLAITNGATFSTAIAALSITKAQSLLKTANLSLSMSLEALQGTSSAFNHLIHKNRNHHGQIKVAEAVRKLTEGSSLLDEAGRVQDSYSLRCAPQVQGPAWDLLEFVTHTVEHELNAVIDNPIILGPGNAVSGGNFHGEPIGLAMDYLKIAMAEVGAISERRTYHMTDGNASGLPSMLVNDQDSAGLNSGMMMPQYTAASLALENQHLAGPDSVLSLPSSGGKEDHNANSLTAAHHTYKLLKNLSHILAVELFSAAQAIDIRKISNPDLVLGKGVQKGYSKIREIVPYHPQDIWWGPEINKIKFEIWENGFFA